MPSSLDLTFVVESAPNAIVVVDQSGRIHLVNAFMELLFGYPRAELLGQPIEILLPERYRAHHSGALSTFAGNPLPRPMETGLDLRGRRKDGTEFALQIALNPVRTTDGLFVIGALMDVTERYKAENELRGALSLQKAIVDSANRAIVSTGLDGTIRTFNSCAERLLGYQADEVIGKATPHLYHDPEEIAALAVKLSTELGRPLTNTLEVFTVGLERGLVNERDWTFIRKDGGRVPVRLSVTALYENGKPTGFVGIAYDLTERKRLEAEIRAARDQAESATQAKSEFLATMSHEIRTPMNGVIGIVHVLLGTDLDSDQQEYAATILNSAESLLAILNEILDYSKIEAGRLEIESLEFDLLMAAEDVLTLLATRAEEKGLELVLRYAPSLPRRFTGDAGRIRQILMNLIGNALKFTQTGHVTIEIGGHRVAAGGSRIGSRAFELKIAVEDTGIGIPLEKQSLLFGRFTQGDNSTARRFGGSGLGLAISKGLVELMGGEVQFMSAPGKGSRFWFSLTLAAVETSPGASVLAGMRILVADRKRVSQEVLVQWMRGRGAEAHGVQTNVAAMRRLLSAASSPAPYQFVIVGTDLEDTPGIELAKAIRQRPELSAVRLIGWAGGGKQETLESIGAAGFSNQIRRPCRYSTLEHSLLESSPQPITTPAPVHAEAAPARAARVLVVEDNTINQRVATHTLLKLGYAVDIAGDGREAIERWEREHYDLILMDCHMPELDGYETTRAIRTREGTDAHIPIVAITASAATGERELCLAAGMDDFVTKPFNAVELRASLNRWLPEPASE